MIPTTVRMTHVGNEFLQNIVEALAMRTARLSSRVILMSVTCESLTLTRLKCNTMVHLKELVCSWWLDTEHL